MFVKLSGVLPTNCIVASPCPLQRRGF